MGVENTYPTWLRRQGRFLSLLRQDHRTAAVRLHLIGETIEQGRFAGTVSPQ